MTRFFIAVLFLSALAGCYNDCKPRQDVSGYYNVGDLYVHGNRVFGVLKKSSAVYFYEAESKDGHIIHFIYHHETGSSIIDCTCHKKQ